MSDKVVKILMGSVFLIAGLGFGYAMVRHPEGLNAEWPLRLALIAPAVFAFGGVHLISDGLGFPRLAIAMIKVLLLCFAVIANWAAFFTTHIQCTEQASFLGITVFQRTPSEESCRTSMQLIVGTADLLVVLGFAAFVWQKRNRSRVEPPSPLQ
jgi:hypothetical protein